MRSVGQQARQGRRKALAREAPGRAPGASRIAWRHWAYRDRRLTRCCPKTTEGAKKRAMSAYVRIKRVGTVGVPLPRYQTSGSAGLDLCAAVEAPLRLDPGARRLVPTGLSLELPEGFE